MEKKERNSDLSRQIEQLSEAKRIAESEAALSQKQTETDKKIFNSLKSKVTNTKKIFKNFKTDYKSKKGVMK